MFDAEVRERALAVAAEAAELADVRVVDVTDPITFTGVSHLFDDVWRPSGTTIMSRETLVAVAHAGGQVSAALRGQTLIGATAAFVGYSPADREVFLHSHVTGVISEGEGRGVGRALKWHQRAWCLERGVGRVRWTYDPLIRRNAVLNLLILGARVVAYREDVYGRMNDARNAGAPTDRLVVDWELTAPRVEAAATGRVAEPDVGALRRAGAEPVLSVARDATPHLTPAEAPRRLVQVPNDIELLRARDPDLGSAWAAAIRATLGAALDAGLRVTGVTRDGWYHLTSDHEVAELADHPSP